MRKKIDRTRYFTSFASSAYVYYTIRDRFRGYDRGRTAKWFARLLYIRW